MLTLVPTRYLQFFSIIPALCTRASASERERERESENSQQQNFPSNWINKKRGRNTTMPHKKSLHCNCRSTFLTKYRVQPSSHKRWKICVHIYKKKYSVSYSASYKVCASNCPTQQKFNWDNELKAVACWNKNASFWKFQPTLHRHTKR